MKKRWIKLFCCAVWLSAKKRWIKLFCCAVWLSAALIGLAGCSHVPSYVKNPTLSNLPEHQRVILADLEHSGVQIIKQGMRFTFVMPTDCFFVKETHELKMHREKDLDHLAQFIHDYAKYFAHPRVSVSGYTDKTWISPARDLLSLHYAQTIAEYLREDGIDADIIRVRGEGAKHPIASNGYPMGTAFNRRVVVVIN